MPTEGWRKNDESQRKADGEKTRVIIGIIIIIIIIVYDFLFLCSQIESFFKSCLFICLFVLFRVFTFLHLSYRLFRFKVIKVHSCSGSPVSSTYLRENIITALSFLLIKVMRDILCHLALVDPLEVGNSVRLPKTDISQRSYWSRDGSTDWERRWLFGDIRYDLGTLIRFHGHHVIKKKSAFSEDISEHEPNVRRRTLPVR